MTDPFRALERLPAASLNQAVRRIHRRGQRTATKTGITAEAGVLRVDNIPVLEDYAYMITISNFGIDGAAATDVGLIRIRYDITGAAATTASTQLSAIRLTVDSATEYPIMPFMAFYFPATDHDLSLLMTAQATVGTIGILPDSSGLDLVVIDLGPDPGDSGVDI